MFAQEGAGEILDRGEVGGGGEFWKGGQTNDQGVRGARENFRGGDVKVGEDFNEGIC